MGYDVEFVQVAVATKTTFPIAMAAASDMLKHAKPFEPIAAVRKTLLSLQGAKEGPNDSIDYIGKGLNYARLSVKEKTIHVDNSLNALELLKVYKTLLEQHPSLLILDLQSGQLHNADSYTAWWSRPL